jgi:hypothetical protein
MMTWKGFKRDRSSPNRGAILASSRTNGGKQLKSVSMACGTAEMRSETLNSEPNCSVVESFWNMTQEICGVTWYNTSTLKRMVQKPRPLILLHSKMLHLLRRYFENTFIIADCKYWSLVVVPTFLKQLLHRHSPANSCTSHKTSKVNYTQTEKD